MDNKKALRMAVTLAIINMPLLAQGRRCKSRKDYRRQYLHDDS